jgi:hypothetical protein
MSKLLTERETQLWNANFWSDVSDPSGQGLEKQGSFFNNDVVIPTLYEDGIARRILEGYDPLTPGDLDVDPDNINIPTKFVPVAEDIPYYLVQATDWQQPSRDYRYRGKIIKVRLHPLTSRTVKLTKNEIIASPFPIRQDVEWMRKKDVGAFEDARFFQSVERAIFARENAGDTAAISSGNAKWLLSDIGDLVKIFEANRVPLGCIAVNSVTFADIYKWTYQDVGSNLIEDLYMTGNVSEGIRFKQFAGYKWAITNNADVIPPKVLYGIGPKQMLGKWYTLQNPHI